MKVTAKNIICGQEVEVVILGKYSDTQTEVRYNNKNFVVTNTDLTHYNECKVPKFTSSVKYTVDKDKDDITGETLATTRFFELTITAQTEEIAQGIWNNFEEYVLKNDLSKQGSGCPTIEELSNNKVSYWDSIPVFNKEEYEELKELYTEWKKEIKSI